MEPVISTPEVVGIHSEEHKLFRKYEIPFKNLKKIRRSMVRFRIREKFFRTDGHRGQPSLKKWGTLGSEDRCWYPYIKLCSGLEI